MPSLEAYVETPRAARYVERLTSHFAHQPGGMKVLASAPGELLVDLGGATWSTRAAQDKLILRVDADDADTLRDLTAHVAGRIEQIGRCDNLEVHWRPEILD